MMAKKAELFKDDAVWKNPQNEFSLTAQRLGGEWNYNETLWLAARFDTVEENHHKFSQNPELKLFY